MAILPDLSHPAPFSDTGSHPLPLLRLESAARETVLQMQDVLGIPWAPLAWRAYGRWPKLAGALWERLRPSAETDLFLRDALALAGMAYLGASSWYRPDSRPGLDPEPAHYIQWELDAFEYGN